MCKIELKIDKEFFDEILSGDKTFDVRLGDRTFTKKDRLIFLEKDPATKKLTGRKIEKIVTYVRGSENNNRWTKKELEKYGFQIIAFK